MIISINYTNVNETNITHAYTQAHAQAQEHAYKHTDTHTHTHIRIQVYIIIVLYNRFYTVYAGYQSIFYTLSKSTVTVI